jgi:hypothetical protein
MNTSVLSIASGLVGLAALLILLFAPAEIRTGVFAIFRWRNRSRAERQLSCSLRAVTTVAALGVLADLVLSSDIRVFGLSSGRIFALYFCSLVCLRAMYLWWKLRLSPHRRVDAPDKS